MGLGDAHLIVQVVPAVAGGVQDYAHCLLRSWSSYGQPSHVLALSQQAAKQLSLAERVGELRPPPAGAIALLIHFSAYGYGTRGLCGWLLDEIGEVRVKFGDQVRVVTMFHELFATGPAWTSAFWLRHAQARIASRLASQSDQVVTNTSLHAKWLSKQVQSPPCVDTWPVFSNVGEPDIATPIDSRLARLVIFGSESGRQRALHLLRSNLNILRDLEIEEVVEVGPGSQSAPLARVIPTQFLGRIEATALSRILGQSRYGLLVYSADTMGKSGVFAAYASHGCVALNAHPETAVSDGLTPGTHYLTLAAIAGHVICASELQAVSDHAKRWYEPHSLRAQAANFARVCGGSMS